MKKTQTKKVRIIKEDVSSANISPISYMVFIDISSYLFKGRGLLNSMFSSKATESITKWFGRVKEDETYKENEEAFKAISSRFMGNPILKKLYSSIDKLKTISTGETDQSERDKDIENLLGKISLFIKNRLTKKERELIGKISTVVNSIGNNISSTIKSDLEAMTKAEAPAPIQPKSNEEKPKVEGKVNERLKNKLRKKIKEIVRTNIINQHYKNEGVSKMKTQKDLVNEGRRIQETFRKKVNEGFFDKIKDVFRDSEEFKELVKQFGLDREKVLKKSDGTVDVANVFRVDGNFDWMDADKKGLALAVNKILNNGTLQISNITGQPTLFKLERWPRICAEVTITKCDLVSFEGFAIELEGGGKVEVNQCDNLKSLKGLPSSLKDFSFGYGDFKNFEDFGDVKTTRIVTLPGTSKMAVEALKASNNDVKAAEAALSKQTGMTISLRGIKK
jgi:hypothetical protein